MQSVGWGYGKTFFSGRSDRVSQLSQLTLVDGNLNTFVGLNSGLHATGQGNTTIGANAASTATSISNVVFVGAQAGEDSVTVQDTVAIGRGAARFSTDGAFNVLVGGLAGSYIQRSTYNTAVGYQSAGTMVSGARNVFVGSLSGYYVVNAQDNVFVGDSAGADARVANRNTCVGSSAGKNLQNSSNNTIIGAFAGLNVSGNASTIIGVNAAGTASENSVVVGSGAAANTADRSVVLGTLAASNAQTSDSVAVGFRAAFDAGTLAESVVIGSNVAAQVSSVASSVIVGNVSGQASVSNVVILGTASVSGSLSNAVAFGSGLALTPADNDSIAMAVQGTDVMHAYTGNLALGPRTDPYFYVDSGGKTIIGNSAAPVVTYDTTYILLGSRTDPYLLANTVGDVVLGQTSHRALTANASALSLGSTADPFFAATAGNAVYVGQTASRALYAYNDTTGYGITVGPTTNPFIVAYNDVSSGSGTFMIGGQIPYFVANIVSNSEYVLELGPGGSVMRMLSGNNGTVSTHSLTLGSTTAPILQAYDYPETTLVLGIGSSTQKEILYANASVFRAGSSNSEYIPLPFPAQPPTSDSFACPNTSMPGVQTAQLYGGGTYNFNASTDAANAYLAFVGGSNYWNSSSVYNLQTGYAGTASTSRVRYSDTVLTLTGEWLDFVLPQSLVPYSITLQAQYEPTVYVLGYNGFNWDQLALPVYNLTSTTILFSTSVSYSTYRIVVTALGVIGQLNIAVPAIIGSVTLNAKVLVTGESLVGLTNSSLTLGSSTNRFITANSSGMSLGPNYNPYLTVNAFGVRSYGVLNFGYPVSNNVICMWGNSTDPGAVNVYGFGINNGVLRYNVPQSSSHIWYSSSTQVATLDSFGNFATTGQLTVKGSLLSMGSPVQNQVISLYGPVNPSATTGWYGFGINPGVLRYQADANGSHTWYSGTTQVASLDPYGLMYATGGFYTGNVHGVFNQGAYIQWNRLWGNGETDFINQKGLGPGGWAWLDYGNQNNLLTESAFLTANGDLSLNGVLTFTNRVQQNLVTLYGTKGPTDVNVYGFGVGTTTVNGVSVPYTQYNSQAQHWWFTNGTNTMQLNQNGVLFVNGTGALSDERLKANIQSANLDTCYNSVKSLALRRFEWTSNVCMQDTNVIGWIAQEVAQVFPKTVYTVSNFSGVSEVMMLDDNQVVKSMYGALQKVIADKEVLETTCADLQAKCANLETRLEIVEAKLGL